MTADIFSFKTGERVQNLPPIRYVKEAYLAQIRADEGATLNNVAATLLNLLEHLDTLERKDNALTKE